MTNKNDPVTLSKEQKELMKFMRPVAWRDAPYGPKFLSKNFRIKAGKNRNTSAKNKSSPAPSASEYNVRSADIFGSSRWRVHAKKYGIGKPPLEDGIKRWDIVNPGVFVKSLVGDWMSMPVSDPDLDILDGLRAIPELYEQAVHPLVAQSVAKRVLSVMAGIPYHDDARRVLSFRAMRYLSESLSRHAVNKTPNSMSASPKGDSVKNIGPVVCAQEGADSEDLVEQVFSAPDERRESPLRQPFSAPQGESVFYNEGVLRLMSNEHIALYAGYQLDSNPEDVKAWARLMRAAWCVYGTPGHHHEGEHFFYEEGMTVLGAEVRPHADPAIVEAIWEVSAPKGTWSKKHNMLLKRWAARVMQTHMWGWAKQKAFHGEWKIGDNLAASIGKDDHQSSKNTDELDEEIDEWTRILCRTLVIGNAHHNLTKEKETTEKMCIPNRQPAQRGRKDSSRVSNATESSKASDQAKTKVELRRI